MKLNKLWILLSLTAGLVLGYVSMTLVTVSCSLDSGGGSGGAGADFNPDLYYTKGDINTLLADVSENIRSVVGMPQITDGELSGAGYAGKVAFAVPDTNVKGALIKITATKPTDYRNICISVGTGTEASGILTLHFTLIPTGSYSYSSYNAFVPFSNATTIEAWHNTSESGASPTIDDTAIKIQPVVWFR
jgi:hypothetical protein